MSAPLHGHTCAGGGQILENWGKVKPKWCYSVMVEAVNHSWLHPTSILDVYKVIEHLHMLWMGIWVHPYMVIPVQVGAKFWKIGVRQSPNVLWCHAWGCKPPLSASHIHIRSLQSVQSPSYAVDGHMNAPLHSYTCAGGGQILENWGKAEPKCAVVSRLRL